MEQTINILKNFNEVVAIVEVGNSLHSIESKDIDFLVITRKIDNTQLKKAFLSNSNVIEIDDSIRILKSENKDINIALYSIEQIKRKVTSIEKMSNPLGEIREWALGYWIPELFLEDITNGRIIYEEDFSFSDLKNYINNFKELINNVLLIKLNQEISIKLNLYMQEKYSLKEQLYRNDILLSVIRLLNIQSNIVENFNKAIFRHSSLIDNLMNLNKTLFKQEVLNTINYSEGRRNG